MNDLINFCIASDYHSKNISLEEENEKLKKKNIIKYVYLVIGDNSFYMELDYELVKIFISYRSAKECLNKTKKSHKYRNVFVVKKALNY